MNDSTTDEVTEVEPHEGQLLAVRLRALADFVETRPTIAAGAKYLGGKIDAFYENEDDWKAALREAGSFRKGASDSFLKAEIVLGDDDLLGPMVTLHADRATTCRRVQIGEREVTREVYPEDVVPTIIQDTEPVYEWVCPDSWIGEK